jgi:hypothetical protein
VWRITNASFLGDHVSMVLEDSRDGTTYAALAHGHFGAKLHRSRDGGNGWDECATPAYPERPDGAPPDVNSIGREIPWKLSMIWALEPGGSDEPGLLWSGTIPGGLFLSRDAGESWELVKSLWDDPLRKQWFGGGYDYPGIHSICVDPRNARRLAVGISCGGVWWSEDGGGSWACHSDGMWAAYMPPERKHDPAIQDPHCLVQCRHFPDTFWVQHHNGVFRSTDDGRSWQEVAGVPPSNFGFAVAVHPSDPDTAWLVPSVSDEHRVPVDGRVVVTRTRDGGKSFEVLSNGLPQDHAYDLTFRHALDVDDSGECLVFGSTTGSLWISQDQGDSWTPISTHLPPIYCVRFG